MNLFKKKSKKTDIPKLVTLDVSETDKTILQTIEECADKIRLKLLVNDCNELVSMHISRNMGIINLEINNEIYIRFNGEWQKIDKEKKTHE